MLFSSLEFLFMFLPVTLIAYFAVPQKYIRARNIVLLAVSLIFYGWGEPLYVFLMIGTVAADYFFGLMIERSKKASRKKAAKAWMIAAVASNLAVLAFFKYCDFFISNLNLIPGVNIKPLGIELPIGISFYTFQIMSYVIDVYRGAADAQRDPLTLGTYLALFPQLIAGPIVRYHDVDLQLSARSHGYSKFSEGVVRFLSGLSKKVLLANTAGEIFESLRAVPDTSRTVVGAWLGVLLFSFQIYFDFSGYSDMAIGLGKMFGFDFLENFDHPYISSSVTEFWRRWHISLSSFFREYVYIPLGGNRRGKARQYFNLFIVWLLTGFWHGASWNYVIWGLFFFVFLVIEKSFFLDILKKIPKWLGRIYAMTVVFFGWLIFYFEDIGEGASWLSNMFGANTASFCDDATAFTLVRNILFIAILVLFSTPAPKAAAKKIAEKHPKARIAAPILCALALILCTAYLVDLSFNPFLYFQF